MKWVIMSVALFVVACSDDTKKSETTIVDITQFDQTCNFDSDCVLVEPNVCGCGSCLGTGLNKNDEAAFNAAREAIVCSNPLECPAIACAETVPSCWEGKCQARQPYVVTADQYDDSCEAADDCIYIEIGDVCSDCRCAVTPVNRASYEENPPPAQECTPGPDLCNCVTPPAIACIDGVCNLGN